MNLYPAQVLLLARAPLVLRLGFGRTAVSEKSVIESLGGSAMKWIHSSTKRRCERSQPARRTRSPRRTAGPRPAPSAAGSNRVLPKVFYATVDLRIVLDCGIHTTIISYGRSSSLWSAAPSLACPTGAAAPPRPRRAGRTAWPAAKASHWSQAGSGLAGALAAGGRVSEVPLCIRFCMKDHEWGILSGV